ncbi:FAD:protein FMN transferase [Paenibacillus cremeus]|uniref:FAD:protein FMN transferase n=1 Tax=Paenibacillus cremeus TaxID=2163881 RepID=A0A559KC82_9BACL|nr:FAD:protein FMN transferase [Paenibacillus cremeus]TVY09699.1 FAD:protein FMN transferase [Paenibacillus cremeus]
MMAAAAMYRVDRFWAMNTTIDLALAEEAADELEVQGWLEEVRRWFAYAEATFSRFLPESELCRLNRSEGRPMLISDTMMEVLQRTAEYRRRTGGKFDPFVLPALERAGYDVSFEHIGAAPLSGASAEGQQKAHQSMLQLNPGMRSARLLGGGRLDLGGIVKGWAVDRISARLSERGVRSGMVNAGGDLCVWGDVRHDQAPWEIDIEAPSGGQLGTVQLAKGSVATSSTLGRRWDTGKGGMHHLIDPQTMEPARSDIVQCTVVGSSVCESEIYAKAICLLGNLSGPDWLKKIDASGTLEAVFVTEAGATHYIGTKEKLESHWSGLTPDSLHF